MEFWDPKIMFIFMFTLLLSFKKNLLQILTMFLTRSLPIIMWNIQLGRRLWVLCSLHRVLWHNYATWTKEMQKFQINVLFILLHILNIRNAWGLKHVEDVKILKTELKHKFEKCTFLWFKLHNGYWFIWWKLVHCHEQTCPLPWTVKFMKCS